MRSLRKLEQTLVSLPRTLDATYERMLSAVDKDHSNDLLKILEFVAFAVVPVSLQLLDEMIVIDLHASPLPQYLIDRRPLSRQYILQICAEMFQVRDPEMESRILWREGTGKLAKIDPKSELRFSHFSVREFLFSERLRKSDRTMSEYSLQSKAAHQHIAECCLAYGLHWGSGRDRVGEPWWCLSIILPDVTFFNILFITVIGTAGMPMKEAQLYPWLNSG
jgi:hypothetical protein